MASEKEFIKEEYIIKGGPGKTEFILALSDRFIRSSVSKEICYERDVTFKIPGYSGTIPELRDTISVYIIGLEMTGNSGEQWRFKGTAGGGGYLLVEGVYSTKIRKGELTIQKQLFPSPIHG